MNVLLVGGVRVKEFGTLLALVAVLGGKVFGLDVQLCRKLVPDKRPDLGQIFWIFQGQFRANFFFNLSPSLS